MKIIKYNLSTIRLGIFVVLLSLFSNSCSMMDQFKKSPPLQPETINNALPFTDIPVPKGFTRDQLNSFVYEIGNSEIKVGRLFFNGDKDLKTTVEFYQNEMINKGWVLLNSIASTDTILNYQKEGWACTVIVKPGSFVGSVLEIQIGPVQPQSK